MTTPTIELYSAIHDLYKYLNKSLFEDTLPDLIIVSQRHAKVTGHFAFARWINTDGNICHEISINPSYISKATLIDLMQTLTHEMCHCWQYCFGRASRPGYHNHQLSKKMTELGIKLTDNGKIDGKDIGYKMYDYPIPGGKFLQVCQDLLQQQKFEMPWLDRQSRHNPLEEIDEDAPENLGESMTMSIIAETIENQDIKEQLCTPLAAFIGEENFEDIEKKTSRRTKYTCIGCKINLWGKKNLKLLCMSCNLELVANYKEPTPEQSE